MRIELDDITIDITPLQKTDKGQVFGFEVRPKDGTPWHSGYVETANWSSAEEIIIGAWNSNNLEQFTKNPYNL